MKKQKKSSAMKGLGEGLKRTPQRLAILDFLDRHLKGETEEGKAPA